MVSQLTSATTDGQPSEDAQDDCVAGAICAAGMYLKGVSQVGGIYTPDNFKDHADGQGYVGFTAAIQYVDFCKTLGVDLEAFNGQPSDLIAHARQEIAAGHPVVFTEPDPYVSSSLGWSHVCVFYGDDNGFLEAMDPYIAKTVTRSYSEWQGLLQFNQVWVLKLAQAPASTPPAQAPLQASDDDIHVWYSLMHQIGHFPMIQEHGIEQSWLRAKHTHVPHLELGPPTEAEWDTGADVRRQFLMGRAVYEKATGETTWFTSAGAFKV